MPDARQLTPTDYDSAAPDYDELRRPGAEVVGRLDRLFSRVAGRGVVLSLGCGTGQYEGAVFGGVGVVGLDRSLGMLGVAQRRVERCVRSDMTELPFADDAFDGVYCVQSLHHVGADLSWSRGERESARQSVLREVVRVLRAGPIALVLQDPPQNAAVWFWKYFPRALEAKLAVQPRISVLQQWLRELGVETEAVALNDPMISGFYTQRAPLSTAFRNSFSEFGYLTASEVAEGVARLRSAIAAGVVADEIRACKERFVELGGTVSLVVGRKLG